MPATTQQQTKKPLVLFQIRLTKDLHDWLVQRAEENGRTRNREIIQMMKLVKEYPERLGQ